MLQRNLLDDFYSRIETRVLLANQLWIHIDEDLENYEHENFGEELALLIKKLPERLWDRKISIEAESLDL